MKKHALMTKTLVVLMMFLLLTSVSSARADDDTTDDEPDDDINDEHEPEHDRDDDGTVWLQTDIMTVMLDSERPSYQYWYSADENGSLARFRVSFLMIVEFEDSNGDGVYQVNETLSFAPLDAFDWSLQTGSVVGDNGQNEEVYASYTKGGLSGEDFEDDWFKDWMPGYSEDSEDSEDESLLASDDDEDDEIDEDQQLNLTRFKGMTLQFYAHMYLEDYNGTVTDDEGVQANYTIVGGVELKVDIEIGNFPFLSNTSKVAVLNYLQEDVASDDDSDHYFNLHEDDGDNEIQSEDIDDGELGEEFDDKDDDHDDDNDVQELSLVDGSTNTTRGIYRWLDKAVQTLPNGSQTAVDVGASYWTNGEAMLLFLAYPNFDGGSLLHDPSVRFIEDAAPITTGVLVEDVLIPMETVAIVAIGVVALAIVALTIRRR